MAAMLLWFLMSDKNNNIIADHMAAWLRQNKLDR